MTICTVEIFNREGETFTGTGETCLPDADPVIVAHLQQAADVHAEPDAETVA